MSKSSSMGQQLGGSKSGWTTSRPKQRCLERCKGSLLATQIVDVEHESLTTNVKKQALGHDHHNQGRTNGEWNWSIVQQQ